MMSLFQTFDKNFFLYSSLISTLMIYLLNKNFYKNSLKNSSMSKMLKLTSMFMNSLKLNMFNKSIKMFMSSLMLMLIWMNLSSIFSFNFAHTSQVSLISFISMSMWVSMMSFKIFKKNKSLISHWIPENTPSALVPFLFIIEMVSSIIRPMTITIRLVANITAGHLLMVLLAKLVEQNKLTITLYLMLNMVEMFVALIQAYIFATMMTLYYAEI